MMRLYVDASYEVRRGRQSLTESCIVIGDVGAVHCTSIKQVTNSSTEAELVGLSDSANEALHLHNFRVQQGHRIESVTVYCTAHPYRTAPTGVGYGGRGKRASTALDRFIS